MHYFSPSSLALVIRDFSSSHWSSANLSIAAGGSLFSYIVINLPTFPPFPSPAFPHLLWMFKSSSALPRVLQGPAIFPTINCQPSSLFDFHVFVVHSCLSPRTFLHWDKTEECQITREQWGLPERRTLWKMTSQVLFHSFPQWRIRLDDLRYRVCGLDEISKKEWLHPRFSSATAAALTHHWDAKCLEYLHTLPSDTLIRLQIIDLLEGLRVARHFMNEIKNILDEVHKQWLKNDEEITSSMTIYAMAFRLLKMHGYGVLSGVLPQSVAAIGSVIQFSMDKIFNHVDTILGSMDQIDEEQGFNTVLELYKASQLKFPDEWSLKELGIWTRKFLAKELSKYGKDERLVEVDHALKIHVFSRLPRLEHRRNIAQFNVDRFQTWKCLMCKLHHIDAKELLAFVIEEFNGYPYSYRKELEHLQRWAKENRLDQLNLRRLMLTSCYFSAAATLFPSEMSDARMSFAKNSVLATLVDDIFDNVGSKEELVNLLQLMGKEHQVNCCSEQVKIIYSALHATINEIGAKASVMQGHGVLAYIINTWRDLLRSFMKEAEWAAEKAVPTMEQYLVMDMYPMPLGPSSPSALFIVPHSCKFLSTCGRLLNDIQGSEREDKEVKLNSVSLLVLEGGGSLSVDERNREELLELILMKEGSIVPRACKDIFWNMSGTLHLFYLDNDEFSSPTIQITGAVNSLIHDPIELVHCSAMQEGKEEVLSSLICQPSKRDKWVFEVIRGGFPKGELCEMIEC
ncbi:unnamed protein product [Spirodela intermedia]|uniref:Uncharacterized protein n=1 Tax=Spirodela intermedia TaxID=51605 RepID=A0A7I8IJX8_SPIIN|nr:unnamed protein product [Spirodela intermedia]CAA6658148.1 unnamed protein product [Spirodela intermedia]